MLKPFCFLYRSPLRSAFHSTWEARHDVNNLDHYQNIVKESEPTPVISRKRRVSNPSGNQKQGGNKKAKLDKSPAKTPGKISKVTFQDESPKTPGKTLKLKPATSTAININMELVPQLRTTPRKLGGETVRRNSTSESLPKALGLVPKTPELQVKIVFII